MFDTGYCEVSVAEGAYLLVRSEFARVEREHNAGATFIAAQGLFGEVHHIKGAKIEAVSDWPPEAVRALNEHRRAMRLFQERDL